MVHRTGCDCEKCCPQAGLEKPKSQSSLDVQVGGGHYKTLKIQPVEYCQKNNLNFCESSAIKYITRHKEKNGKEDIKKAIHFLQMLLEMEYGEVQEEQLNDNIDIGSLLEQTRSYHQVLKTVDELGIHEGPWYGQKDKSIVEQVCDFIRDLKNSKNDNVDVGVLNNQAEAWLKVKWQCEKLGMVPRPNNTSLQDVLDFIKDLDRRSTQAPKWSEYEKLSMKVGAGQATAEEKKRYKEIVEKLNPVPVVDSVEEIFRGEG